MVGTRSTLVLRMVAFAVSICFAALPANAKYSGGTGEPNDPYQTATAADLMALGETPADYDKHFILTADIDLDPNLPGGKAFDRAIIAPDTDPDDKWGAFQGPPFTGVFAGNGHTIKNLKITGARYLGLFGRLDSAANVSDLGLEAVMVSGTGGYVGGLVGENLKGRIFASSSSGSVSGTWFVGGLVGKNVYSSIGSNYTSGSVRGFCDVGGLVGWNLFGRIINCYSCGLVTGVASLGVGGLLGSNLHGSALASTWDLEASGQTASAGGMGKTTAETQTASTFLDAGWDFVGETANGTEDIWWIDEGKDYPRLWWEPKKDGSAAGADD